MSQNVARNRGSGPAGFCILYVWSLLCCCIPVMQYSCSPLSQKQGNGIPGTTMPSKHSRCFWNVARVLLLCRNIQYKRTDSASAAFIVWMHISHNNALVYPTPNEVHNWNIYMSRIIVEFHHKLTSWETLIKTLMPEIIPGQIHFCTTSRRLSFIWKQMKLKND